MENQTPDGTPFFKCDNKGPCIKKTMLVGIFTTVSFLSTMFGLSIITVPENRVAYDVSTCEKTTNASCSTFGAGVHLTNPLVKTNLEYVDTTPYQQFYLFNYDFVMHNRSYTAEFVRIDAKIVNEDEYVQTYIRSGSNDNFVRLLSLNLTVNVDFSRHISSTYNLGGEQFPPAHGMDITFVKLVNVRHKK